MILRTIWKSDTTYSYFAAVTLKIKKSGYILKLLNMTQLLSLLRRQAINLVAGLTCCNKPIQINHVSAVNTYQYLRIFQ